MKLPVGLALLAVGVVLLIFGINAADSVASHVKDFFTGNPTDKSIWLLLFGVAGIIAGAATLFYPGRRLPRA
ncbi:MAG TPA: DUF3185 family protein [Phycisphaerales bacterium]|nr:DUF3185 family protein [Phycisphaerales bacterium]